MQNRNRRRAELISRILQEFHSECEISINGETIFLRGRNADDQNLRAQIREELRARGSENIDNIGFINSLAKAKVCEFLERSSRKLKNLSIPRECVTPINDKTVEINLAPLTQAQRFFIGVHRFNQPDQQEEGEQPAPYNLM